MDKSVIEEISIKEFHKRPLEIKHKTIGICNEVYELTFPSENFIIRLNQEKEWIFGTHKFLPIFKQLNIKTPDIVAEDYTKSEFNYCYQILTKIPGEDLGIIFEQLTAEELTGIAKEVSSILDKFKGLSRPKTFGCKTGLKEEMLESQLAIIEGHQDVILQRNESSKVLKNEILDLYRDLIAEYKDYFRDVTPYLYYDDICSKNVMIYNGLFAGLVDLDFIMKGDYLEALGRIEASWYGNPSGKIYLNEIVRCQGLNEFQRKLIKVYAILNLVLWTSEEGVKFNDNTSGQINWDRVHKKEQIIRQLYKEVDAN